MIAKIYSRIRQNGLPWFIARLRLEFRSPTTPYMKAWIDGLLSLRKKLLRSSVGAQDDPFLYVIYDLDVSATTYNFGQFLIDAEYEMRRNHKTGFVVVFVPTSNNPMRVSKEYDSVIDAKSRQWRFENLVVPLTFLSPNCKGTYILPRRSDVIAFVKGRNVYPYLYDGVNLRGWDYKEFFRNKLVRPGLFEGLRASEQGLRYIQAWVIENKIQAPIITITIRNLAFDSVRNSNIEAWSQFASYLRSSGYHPVIIPDTDTAFHEESRFEGVTVFPECAWNMGLRMALYELSFLNFFAPNGCSTLAIYNPKCSYIMMNLVSKGSIIDTEEAYREMGYRIGDNYKFATPNQRLSFKPDSYENILSEFNLFLEIINSGSAGLSAVCEAIMIASSASQTNQVCENFHL